MDLLKQAEAAVVAAEAEIKRLASQAIISSEWTAVSTLASWAQALRSILDFGVQPLTARHSDVAPKDDLASRSSPEAGPKQIRETTAKSAAKSVGRGSPNRHAAAKTRKADERDYPRFVRDGDSLVKIGWSKKDRSEYEHRAPRDVLDKIVDAITKVAINGSQFSVEEILSLVNTSSAREEIPTYQTYLCIAWLRQRALLEQHGRQGYSCTSSFRLRQVVEDNWSKTPLR